jgi:hypothetical protein
MDNKQAASNDDSNRQENDAIELQQRRRKAQEESLAYAETALDWLLTFTSAPDLPQNSSELKLWRANWIHRIAMIPKYKIDRLNEFNGPFLKNVWEFFEGIQDAPITYSRPALPEPKSSYGKAICEHIEKLTSCKTRREMREFEMKSLKKINEKYPGRGLDSVIRSRQEDYKKISVDAPLVR